MPAIVRKRQRYYTANKDDCGKDKDDWGEIPLKDPPCDLTWQ